MGHQIMALRMGKAGALFLWVRNKIIRFRRPRVAVSPADICVSHSILRLPNCSPSLLEDSLCL